MTSRILCSLPALPDRNTGGGVLLYETLLYLQSRGEVCVVLPVANHLREAFREVQHDTTLSSIEWNPLEEALVTTPIGRVRRLLGRMPVEVVKFATATNQAVLENARATFDPTTELLISSRAAAAYAGFSPPPTARLYMMDVEPRIIRYKGPVLKRRLASALEYPKVDRLCRWVLRTAGRVGAISEADIEELNRMGGRHDVAHVPPLMMPRAIARLNIEPFHVIITTNFSYSPNVDALRWFLSNCWPHVDKRARLTVTGLDAGGTLATLCMEHPRVTYAGCLPRNELDQLLGRVAVAVNPTRTGSGFQIKLLDAISRGVPIVSTSFSNRIGPAIPSSDDPVQLAKLINARLTPEGVAPVDYAAFYNKATEAWDHFLFH